MSDRAVSGIVAISERRLGSSGPGPARRLASNAKRFASYTGYVYGWYALPMALVAVALWYLIAGAGTDFEANVWRPGLALLHGASPYPKPELSALVGHATFLYPPPLLYFDAPFALLPHAVARTLFFVLTAAVTPLALWLIGVGDRRVHLVAGLSFPVWYAIIFGNPTVLLLVPVACAWRYRDHPWGAGLAVGCAVAFKLIVWPLGLWLLVTRRFKSTGIAIATSIVLVFGSWATIGFKGLSDYPHLIRMFSETTAAPRAFTISTLGGKLGLASSVAHGLQWACGLMLLAAVVALASRVQGDRRSFSMAIATALVITPVVELWYLALLLVPLALACPTYSRPWSLVRWAWIFPLLPRGAYQVVEDDGRMLHSLGRIPSIPQMLLVGAFLVGATWVTTRAPVKPRDVRYPSRRPAAIV
jgi:Glycosyltransferase family 87